MNLRNRLVFSEAKNLWGERLSERVLSDTVTPARHRGCSCHQCQVSFAGTTGYFSHPKECGFQNLKVPRGGCVVSGLDAKPSSRFVLLPLSHAVIIFDLCRKALLSTVLK